MRAYFLEPEDNNVVINDTKSKLHDREEIEQ